jgi:hypothetical protein
VNTWKNVSNPPPIRAPTDEAPSFPLLRLSAVGVPFPHSHPATPPTAGLPRLDGGLLLPSTEPQRSPRPGTSDLSSPAASCSCSCSSRSREGGEILPVAVDPAASVRRRLVGVAAPVPASHHATRRCRDHRAVGAAALPALRPAARADAAPYCTRRCRARRAHALVSRLPSLPTSRSSACPRRSACLLLLCARACCSALPARPCFALVACLLLCVHVAPRACCCAFCNKSR